MTESGFQGEMPIPLKAPLIFFSIKIVLWAARYAIKNSNFMM